MLHDLLKIIWVQSVEDIEEILPWRAFTDWILIRKVLGKLRILGQRWPESLYRQLVIMWDHYILNFGLFHEHLLSAQNILQEVLVHDVGVRQIVLD